MKNIKHLIVVFLLLGMYSCAPKTLKNVVGVLPPNENYDEKILLIGLYEDLPAQATILGSSKLETSMDVPFNLVLQAAESEARSMGGNAVKITGHYNSKRSGTRHELYFDVLYIPDVSTYRMEIYSSPEAAAEAEAGFADDFGGVERRSKEVDVFFEDPSWSPRLRVYGGSTVRLFNYSSSATKEMRDYAADLRYGYSYGADLDFLFDANWSMGFQYSNSTTAAATSNYNGKSLSEESVIHYIGINGGRRFRLAERHALSVYATFGNISYRSTYLVDGRNGEEKVDTYACGGSFGYEYNITKRLSVGTQAYILFGNYAGLKLKMSSANSMPTQLGYTYRHLNLTLGVRYRFLD